MNPPGLYLPHSHDAAPGFLSLAWRTVQGVTLLACITVGAAGVACLTFIR